MAFTTNETQIADDGYVFLGAAPARPRAEKAPRKLLGAFLRLTEGSSFAAEKRDKQHLADTNTSS
jgi:hypothetical protein